jgi:hypothetical protein
MTEADLRATTERISRDLRIDPRMIEQAIALIRHGQADLLDGVRTGRLNLSQALKIARSRQTEGARR